MKKLLLLFIPLVLLFGCEGTLTNDIYAEIDVVSDVESILRYTPNAYIEEKFYLTGSNTSASLVSQNYEALPTEGFYYWLQVYDWELGGVGCLDIEIRIYKNGDLKQTENIQLGFVAAGDYCATHGNWFTGEL